VSKQLESLGQTPLAKFAGRDGLEQLFIDPMENLRPFKVRDEVDVAGPGFNGLVDDEVYQSDDGEVLAQVVRSADFLDGLENLIEERG
jgi:hypothetical protein